MQVLFDKKKKYADRTVRCYLTLKCNSNCEYCSAGVPHLTKERKKIHIPAEHWAEGLNNRARAAVLAGGEPFLYPQFGKLIRLLDPTYPVWIYTNLEENIKPFLKNATRPYPLLVSLHQNTNFDVWYKNLRDLWLEGHFAKFHIIKSGDYKKVTDFLEEKDIVGQYSTHLCGDQRGGIKSRGEHINDQYPAVSCRYRIYLYGPDGYRYMCVTRLGWGSIIGKYEHILEDDGPEWMEIGCENFGLCVGCDNNIEGTVLCKNPS